MHKVKVQLQNCYGIRSLDTEFDFTHKSANLIYAPNGLMKTSLAKTFKDHSENQQSQDEVYPDRETSRVILNENGESLSPHEVFVAEPYDASYESDRLSTLLANKELKIEYDEILKGIDKKSVELVKLLQQTSGVKSGLEDIISFVFTKVSGNLLRAFFRIKAEVLDDTEDPSLVDIKFNTLFSERIEKLISEPDIKEALEEYTANYDALVSKSRFFRKGVFNHYQAGEIAKQLKTHGFFKANHRLSLYSGKSETKVESEVELERLINEELSSILSDEQLKASFDKIDKKLTNKELREFREFLLANQTLIPRLQNPELLKEDLLKSYLRHHRENFASLMDEYENGKKRLEEIAKEASEQATKWQDVINIFNRRFSVPFEVRIENKEDVILKRVTPNIGFIFEDESADPKPVEQNALLKILSSGERRALYILNIIFEVEARISDAIPTLFIFDDIADSFDYKNKYAIVEYLSDILDQGEFKQIILTHNYDFYRTVWRRLSLGGANLHVSKSANGITLKNEKMYRDPFEKWKSLANSESNTDALIAMVPFVRNLSSYCGFQEEYSTLTSLLHIKSDSHKITVQDLLKIFSKILNGQKFSCHLENGQAIVPVIIQTAKFIANSDETDLDLEKKIVLSIGIRLRAEQVMIDIIDDLNLVSNISSNQTAKLIKRFKEVVGEKTKDDTNLVDLMDRVNLMTPENIHLNSFMYEPILDMSSKHLSDLYKELDQISFKSNGKELSVH